MHLVYTYPKLTRIENACCLILHFCPAQYSTSFKQDWTQILTSKPCLLYLFENIHSHDMTNTWVVLEFSPFLTYFSPFFFTFFIYIRNFILFIYFYFFLFFTLPGFGSEWPKDGALLLKKWIIIQEKKIEPAVLKIIYRRLCK